ncbi:MAG: molybdopterin-guanine dinucleotide biosynthesis protein B [Candidatus Methanospirareceae archaeon]
MKVISIVGKKGSGKTSLIERLVKSLKKYGKVGCIKHAQHLDFCKGMKDTERFLRAGADVVIGASSERTIKISDGKGLEEMIADMAKEGVDFLIIEGYKSSNLPKIALGDLPEGDVKGVIRRIDLLRGEEDKKIEEIISIILSLKDINATGEK